jgi:hypothetical protein
VQTLSDHIEVADHGSVIILTPISDAARNWFLDNIGPATSGPGYLCEPRYAGPICQDAARALLKWS